jgi:hypothetical protein
VCIHLTNPYKNKKIEGINSFKKFIQRLPPTPPPKPKLLTTTTMIIDNITIVISSVIQLVAIVDNADLVALIAVAAVVETPEDVAKVSRARIPTPNNIPTTTTSRTN